MIRHASVYDIGQGPEIDGWRVLIMRRWPRGVPKHRVDTWLKDAGPSPELLTAYTHQGLPWAEFEHRYREEMASRPALIHELKALEREHGTVTLLCRERIPPDEHCHRLVLAELLTSGRAEPD